MKREKLVYNLPIPEDDYKIQSIMTEDKKNFESVDKWLYVGADIKNEGFAKIGITTGNLQSRSYSSANPNYYIFCAFKCIHDISKKELKSIEEMVLSILDRKFTNEHGVTKRVRHFESNAMSECFYDIDFKDILYNVHLELYEKHRRYFSTSGLFDNDENDLGDVLDCEFNRKISIKKAFEYRQFISQ